MTKRIGEVLIAILLCICFCLSSCGRNNQSTKGHTSSEEAVPLEEELKSMIGEMISDAEKNLNNKKEELDYVVSSAASGGSSLECLASDDTVVNCCWDALKGVLNNPYTATLVSHGNVVRDSYGRVACILVYSAQNNYGNYLTKDACVVLQSCSTTGRYTYKNYVFYTNVTDNNDYLKAFLSSNDFNSSSSEDSQNESDYQKGIERIKKENYNGAIYYLEKTDSYKMSNKLIDAINDYLDAKQYYDGLVMYKNGDYSKCAGNMRTLLNKGENGSGYMSSKLVLEVCETALRIENDMENPDTNNSVESTKSETSINDNETSETIKTIETKDTKDTTKKNENNTTKSDNTNQSNDKTNNSSGSQHQHSFVLHSGKAATCTESGYYDYRTCSCGYTDYLSIPALGHEYAFSGSKDSTCEDAGYYEYVCARCGDSYKDTIPATGHNYSEATCSVPKTCSNCGKTIGNTLPHDMYYTKCRNCDYSDFSSVAMYSNAFCLSSWYNKGNGSNYLDDGEASISIDANGICNVCFDDNSYTFSLKQTDVDCYGLHFACYQNGVKVEKTEVFFSQNDRPKNMNRCSFSSRGNSLGYSQIVLEFSSPVYPF